MMLQYYGRYGPWKIYRFYYLCTNTRMLFYKGEFGFIDRSGFIQDLAWNIYFPNIVYHSSHINAFLALFVQPYLPGYRSCYMCRSLLMACGIWILCFYSIGKYLYCLFKQVFNSFKAFPEFKCTFLYQVLKVVPFFSKKVLGLFYPEH